MAVNTIEGGNSHGEMAWEARSGLKPVGAFSSWASSIKGEMAWEARSGLKHYIVTKMTRLALAGEMAWEARSGLKPVSELPNAIISIAAKWPGKPVRV